ncbi:MAG TPA: phage holin family protein [Sphingopyxis sp.]|nr:phage holin family protein [Sphingopyxis sp.]HMP46628.1 phage holin family protein [Sphingopyxis sp.]HMQ19769.1 phage holin family protein [Sphingopyxis sp.]
MASPDPDATASDDRGLGRVSHGYAPGGPADAPPPVPLSDIVRDVVDDLQATAKAELALLEARGAVAGHGIKWASVWGFIAACALLVAMLAVAFGAILALMPHVGALLATLIVFAALILLAAFAGWRAKRSADDIRAAFRSDLMPEEED